jgi:catechol 2,3-dioxygenase-like lactoylglutathione lyase family enzyme
MTISPVVISLPTSDRRTSYAFYRDVLGLEAIGEPADDGVPEPLQFVLSDGARLMFIPTRGFGWVTGGHKVAEPGHSECVLSFAGDPDEVLARARAAGAEIIFEPGDHGWGYVSAFADPDGHVWMVTVNPVPHG